MRVRLQLVAFLSFTIMPASCGNADRQLPVPQVNFSGWMDGFVAYMNWSWQKPETLPSDCVVKYEIQQKKKIATPSRVDGKDFTQYYLSEDLTSSTLELMIHAKPDTGCNGWNESQTAEIKLPARKKHSELVKDFRCFYIPNGFNCSWIPINPSADLKVSYRPSGKEQNDIQRLKVCEPYKKKEKNWCYMECEKGREIFVLVETKTRMTTFKPKNAIYVPKMSIDETGSYLKLTWKNPSVGQSCDWNFCLWYKECGNDKSPECYKIHTVDKIVEIPYKTCCGYEFQYNVSTDEYCTEVFSDPSEVITYGTTTPCLSAANVAAIIIPIIVFFFVVLSFYCFKKHDKIFGCTKLDSSIIKGILNVNKDNKIPQQNLVIPLTTEHTDMCTAVVAETGHQETS